MKTWYQMTAEEALRGMESSHGGLSSGQAEVRCGQFGENVLQEHAGKKIWQVFLEQFQDLLVLILIVAAAISVPFWQWGECGCYFCGDHHECGIGNDSA